MELRDFGMFDDAVWKMRVGFIAKFVAAATGLIRIGDWSRRRTRPYLLDLEV